MRAMNRRPSPGARARFLLCVVPLIGWLAACGGGGGDGGGPTDPLDDEFLGVGSGARPITLIDEPVAISEFGFGFQFNYSDGFTSPGRLTATVSYEPAATLVQVTFARSDGLGGCGGGPLPSNCTSLGEVEASDGQAVLVVESVPALAVPAEIFNPDPESPFYDLLVLPQAAVEAHLLVRFEPDPNAPRPPEIGGVYALDATLTGAQCGDPALSGPFQLSVDQIGVFIEGSIHEADGFFTGRVEGDGSFEMSGEVTPVEGGATTTLTLTGRVTGTSMSGNFSRQWPDGCVSMGTFSGSRR